MNETPHCTLCADHLVRTRSYQGDSATRIIVNGVWICLAHDLIGAVAAYPAHIRDAVRGTTET